MAASRDSSSHRGVSVVIPTHNRATLLQRAVRTAGEQEEVDVEVIVIDDGSSDGTADWLRDRVDDRVRHHRFGEAQGVARARNHGIVMATKPWVAFLDDDDLWAPGKLRLQIDAAAEASSTGPVYAGAIEVRPDMQPLKVTPAPAASSLATDIFLHNPIPAGASNVLAGAALLRQERGFDTSFSQLADWDLWIRLARRGTPVACPDVLVAYTMHDANMVGTAGLEVLDEFERLAQKHGADAEAAGVAFDRARFERWVVAGMRRSGRRIATARLYMHRARRTKRFGDVARAGIAATVGMPRLPRRQEGPVTPPDWLART
jgi:glycosyltransferase involved in cell wall biosynthesis